MSATRVITYVNPSFSAAVPNTFGSELRSTADAPSSNCSHGAATAHGVVRFGCWDFWPRHELRGIFECPDLDGPNVSNQPPPVLGSSVHDRISADPLNSHSDCGATRAKCQNPHRRPGRRSRPDTGRRRRRASYGARMVAVSQQKGVLLLRSYAPELWPHASETRRARSASLTAEAV